MLKRNFMQILLLFVLAVSFISTSVRVLEADGLIKTDLAIIAISFICIWLALLSGMLQKERNYSTLLRKDAIRVKARNRL